jgi:hypothetical protein
MNYRAIQPLRGSAGRVQARLREPKSVPDLLVQTCRKHRQRRRLVPCCPEPAAALMLTLSAGISVSAGVLLQSASGRSGLRFGSTRNELRGLPMTSG